MTVRSRNDFALLSLASLLLVLIGTQPAFGHDPGAGCTHNHTTGNVEGDSTQNTCNGDELGQNVWGRGANDFMSGWAGNDNVYGDDGNDIVEGNDGADYVYGGTFQTDDSVRGGNGDDTVDDSNGVGDSDILCDGDGNDVVNMQDGDNRDQWRNAPDGKAEVSISKDPADIIVNNATC